MNFVWNIVSELMFFTFCSDNTELTKFEIKKKNHSILNVIKNFDLEAIKIKTYHLSLKFHNKPFFVSPPSRVPNWVK